MNFNFDCFERALKARGLPAGLWPGQGEGERGRARGEERGGSRVGWGLRGKRGTGVDTYRALATVPACGPRPARVNIRATGLVEVFLDRGGFKDT